MITRGINVANTRTLRRVLNIISLNKKGATRKDIIDTLGTSKTLDNGLAFLISVGLIKKERTISQGSVVYVKVRKDERNERRKKRFK